MSARMSQLPDATDDQPVDVLRFLTALRRAWWLIALIVVPFTGAVLVLSLVLPKTYDATARLVVQDNAGALAGADNDAMTRRLATIQTLLTSRDVLTRAAEDLPRETADTLEDKVNASVDDRASIVDVQATDDSADGAATIANGVTETFLEQQRGDERQRFADARRDLQAALERLQGTSGAGGGDRRDPPAAQRAERRRGGHRRRARARRSGPAARHGELPPSGTEHAVRILRGDVPGHPRGRRPRGARAAPERGA